MSITYEERKNYVREHSAKLGQPGRSIGQIPPEVDSGRRERAEGSFETFLKTYWPESPSPAPEELAWAESGVRGGLVTVPEELACPAVLWAILGGHKAHVIMIARDETSARCQLDAVKAELTDSDLLLEDFPAICFPITQRRRIPGWSKNAIVLPTTPGSAASGSTVKAMSPRDRISGLLEEPLPDLVVIVVD